MSTQKVIDKKCYKIAQEIRKAIPLFRTAHYTKTELYFVKRMINIHIPFVRERVSNKELLTAVREFESCACVYLVEYMEKQKDTF